MKKEIAAQLRVIYSECQLTMKSGEATLTTAALGALESIARLLEKEESPEIVASTAFLPATPTARRPIHFGISRPPAVRIMGATPTEKIVSGATPPTLLIVTGNITLTHDAVGAVG